MAQDLRFLEIEHKFILPNDFQTDALFQKLRQFQPEKFLQTEVSDTYFFCERAPSAVFRYRLDAHIEQFTVKSQGQGNEVRHEVNLALQNQGGGQRDAVTAFLEPLGLFWSGTLTKSVSAFFFRDAEIVFYRARYEGQELCCLEVEAKDPLSLDNAYAILAQWEQSLGLSADQRSQSSLFELLIFPQLRAEIRQKIRETW